MADLACARVFGGMVLAQPMTRAITDLEAVLGDPRLTRAQRRRGIFFLGKAHQMEQRDREADRAWRTMLPAWARPVYPLLRQRLRALP